MTETTIVSPAAETDRGTPPISRVAFTRYASELLGALCALGELRGDGVPRPVDGFRLRSHREDQPTQRLSKPFYELAGSERTPVSALLSALLRMSAPKVDNEVRWSANWSGAGDSGSWSLPAPEGSADFAFGYPVPPVGPDARPGNDAEFGADVLAILLDTVDPVVGEEVVHIDEFSLNRTTVPLSATDPTTLPDLGARQELPGSGLQPLHTVAATEPTIVTVARHWSLIAELIRVRDEASIQLPLTQPDAKTEEPDQGQIIGFVLRDLSEWLVESECHPAEIYEYLARVCNVACQFCYLFGNPSDLAVARGKKVIAEDEISTRLRYFRPDRGLTLFKSQWEINEFLVDPKLPQVLRELRTHSDQEFYFITNGSPLLPRVIDLLDEVRPVTLIVSTNTIEAPLRQQVMNERRKQTETALDCLERLADRELPFGLSFIVTPEFPVEKLADALRKIEPLRPAMVRVNLPGFTRDHPYQIPFDIDALWERATREIAMLRAEFSTPIVVIPSAYEANLLYEDPHNAQVTGAVPGSPAAQAGFRPGDVIERVGAFPISSRSQALALMMTITGRTTVRVDRDGTSVPLSVDPKAVTSYPYTGHVIGKYVVPQGLVASPSLGIGDARVMKQAIESTGARCPWLVTSPLMYQQAQSFTARWVPEHAERLHHLMVNNEYLGGNIQVMDMATIGDIYRAVQDEIGRTGTKPDLLLVPGTGFNREGRDISGRHWGDLSRALRLPVRLLDVTTQFLF